MSFYTYFSDPFNEADGPLDSVSPGNWQKDSGEGCEILSQKCTFVQGDGTERLTAITLPADQWASFKIAAWDLTTGDNFDIVVRSTSTTFFGANGYDLGVTPLGDGSNVRVELVENTLGITLWSNPSLAAAVGDVFLLSAQGTTISWYQNGTLVASVTDSTNSSGSVWISLRSGTFPGTPGELSVVDFLAGSFVPAPSTTSASWLQPHRAFVNKRG